MHCGTVHFCCVLKRMQCIDCALRIVLCCEQEAVHCGTVHGVVLERNCALWDCALCHISKEGDTALEVKCVWDWVL